MRELEAVKQEALMLQEQMKMIKYDIQKVCVSLNSWNCEQSVSVTSLLGYFKLD